MVSSFKLDPISQTTFEVPAPAGYPHSCPVLDIAATLDSSGRNVLIYRPDGELVCKLQQGGRIPSTVTATRWKHNGQFIAVAWKDGIIRLMSLETGKATHHIPVFAPNTTTKAEVTYITWSRASIPLSCTSLTSDVLKSVTKDISSDDVSSEADVNNVLSNLPLEITFLDLEVSLPKLSPLPISSAGSGEDAVVFTQRSAIDFIFQPFDRNDATEISVLLAGMADGSIFLSIHDSFPVGSIPYPLNRAEGEPTEPVELVHHASNPTVSSQMLVFKHKKPDYHHLDIVSLDMPFLGAWPINLTLLSSKLTSMHKLLRYIKQTMLHIQVEFNNTRDLPNRFINSAVTSMKEDPSLKQDIVVALYQAALTGNFNHKLKEWMVDSIGDRNIKRWNKAVQTGLAAMRSLIQEHLTPALQRLSIVTSRLDGFAKFHEGNDQIGLHSEHFRGIRDLISILTLLSSRALLCVSEELKAYRSFTAWMAFSIEKLTTPSTADDISERNMIDMSQVVLYILEYLQQSPIKPHMTTDLGDGSLDEEFTSLSATCEKKGIHMVELMDSILNQEPMLNVTNEASAKLLQFGEVTGQLERLVKKVLDSVATSERRTLRFGEKVRVELTEPMASIHSDMIAKNASTNITYTAILTTSRNKVLVNAIENIVTSGKSKVTQTATTALSFGGLRVVDIRILANHLICAVDAKSQAKTESSIYKYHLSKMEIHGSQSPYAIYVVPFLSLSWQSPTGSIELETVENVYAYPLPGDIEPCSLDAHGASDVRNVLAARVCLLDSTRTTYSSYGLTPMSS